MSSDPIFAQTCTPIGKWEKVFVVGLLLYAGGGFLNVLKGSSDLPTGASTGSALTNCLWVLGYLGAGYLAVRGNIHRQVRLRELRWLVILTAYTVVSVCWSEVPFLSVLRAGALLGTTLIGLYFGGRFSWKGQLELLATAVGVAAVASLLMVLFLPSYGIAKDDFEGAWLGIYAHKNGLGSAMALGCLILLLLSLRATKGRVGFWCLTALCGVLLIFAQSVTSLVACSCTVVFVLFSTFAVRHKWSRVRRAFVFVCVAAICLGFVGTNYAQVVEALGRDENLTGRTAIWALVWNQVQDQPLLGYGYGGFWAGVDGPSLSVWRVFGDQSVYHAHNGMLEVWAECGIVGLGLLVLCFWDAVRKALRAANVTADVTDGWPLYFLVLLFLFDLVEVGYLQSNQVTWILFVAIAMRLAMDKEKPQELYLNKNDTTGLT
jgi:exopolysaccharide production protein ExoQ